MATSHVSATVLAQYWDDITPRRVQQLAREGIIPKAAHGRYPLVACNVAYIRYLKGQIDGKTETASELGQARLQKEQLEVRRREIEVAKAEGSVIAIEDHLEVVQKVLDRTRSVVLAIPGGWGSRVIGLQSMAEGVEAMRLCGEEIIRGIASTAQEFMSVEPAVHLPEAFPGYRQLLAAGVTTLEALRALEDPTTVRGIGPKIAGRIQEALAN